MISRSASYAIRSLSFLTSSPDRPWRLRRTIADATGVPPSFLGKVLQTLVAEGLLESRRGRGGGFRLARDPRLITLLDVVEPFDHFRSEPRCLLDRPSCSHAAPCSLHAQWRPVRDTLVQALHDTTVADVPAEPPTAAGLPVRR
jgi:Rrf2 family iron-sulfur cluster assembly transcriptional regulator